MSTFMNKILISTFSSVTFGLLNSQLCPLKVNLIIRSIIFAILTYLSMGTPNKNIKVKLKRTSYGTLMFYFISSTMDCSIISAILYGLILFIIMY
jgi:hypothetical protein